jgi:hypothetical protein
MAARTSDILMTGITDLFTRFLEFLGVGEQHVFGVVQVMAGAIVAKALAMTLVTILLLGFGGGTM